MIATLILRMVIIMNNADEICGTAVMMMRIMGIIMLMMLIIMMMMRIMMMMITMRKVRIGYHA